MYKEDGVPANKKPSLTEFAKINAKILAKEFKNGTKNVNKKKKKKQTEETLLEEALTALTTNELAVRKLSKRDFDPQKGYYDLSVMREDYFSLNRNQVYVKRAEYQ